MKPLNILFVFPAYEPAWRFGGIVSCMSDICRAMAALGHRVTVYSINADGAGGALDVPVAVPVNQGGVTTYFFPPMFKRGSNWASQALVQSLHKTIHTFDLVYVAASWQWIGIETARLCAARNIPLITGLHGAIDDIHMKHRFIKKWLYWRFFQRKALQRSAALHFTTEYERQQSLKWSTGVKSFIAPNGVECNDYSKDELLGSQFRMQHHIPDDAPVVLTVGRIDPIKRVDSLIRAVAAVSEAYLVVVGSGSRKLEQAWRQLAVELDIDSRVVWTGHLEGKGLLAAYSSANLFSLISKDENFGMVVVEALCSGLPILVTPQVGVWSEVKTMNVGKAVNNDVNEIIEALHDFINNPAIWAQHAVNAPVAARRKFEIKQVTHLMEQAFYDVMGNVYSQECSWQLSH